MRLVTTAALLIAVMAGLRPAASAAPLTAEQIRAGWIMLFDGETTYGWRPRGDSKWTVKGGALEAGAGKGVLATTSEFADFELDAECWVDERANSGIFLRAPADGEITSANAYEVNLSDAHKKWPTGSINEVQRARARLKSAARWTSLHILALGDHLMVRADGRTVVDARDGRISRGAIALQYNADGQVKFRDIRLKPLGMHSIFNGYDLTGWRIIPGHPSVFSVTREGWLNVKNGNGEIQTEAKFGDFVLQMEVISNGAHLNSGIFFRANAGAFWSGYENQIRNQWEGSDRSKAVDYGTGGIYNRQPARKVVSSDRQWFTDTLIASGLHMAVWIDGYQVSDFYDTRLPDESNARRGARTLPGVITIQGHDPTTDLSFRNIFAGEYPPRTY